MEVQLVSLDRPTSFVQAQGGMGIIYFWFLYSMVLVIGKVTSCMNDLLHLLGMVKKLEYVPNPSDVIHNVSEP